MSEKDIEHLLEPYRLEATCVRQELYEKLSLYLQLLLKWNARTNLTAIREPEEIVRRHFGESLFAAQHLGECETLLDFGSGAGFPGLPIQLMRPDIKVTLAESQNKKAAFLREAIRTLGLATELWSGRVEAMPEARRFDVVAMRAVDNMEMAVISASERAERQMLLLTTSDRIPVGLPAFTARLEIPISGAARQALLILERDRLR